MELIIDNFEDNTDWTTSSADVVLTDNEFSEHVLAGTKSLRIKAENADGEYIEKKYDAVIDVSEYRNLRFFLSKYSDIDEIYTNKFGHFKLKIAIGTTTAGVFNPADEWFVPVWGKKNLEMVNIDISHINTFNTIRFTFIGDSWEIWWIDHLIACNDEFVIDSLLAIKDALDCKVKFLLGKSPVAIVEGSTSINLPEYGNVGKYSVIQIEEAGKVERHIVAGEVSNGSVEFENESYFDGQEILNDFTTNADIYLVIPALIAGKSSPMVVPGIFISGMVPIVKTAPLVEVIRDSFKVSSLQCRYIKPVRDLSLPVQVAVQSDLPELMIAANNYLQNLLSDTGVLLINGVKHDIIYGDTPQYDPGDLEGEIPYTIHFYNVEIIDILNADISFVTFPSSYDFTLNVESKSL